MASTRLVVWLLAWKLFPNYESIFNASFNELEIDLKLNETLTLLLEGEQM